MRLSFILSGLLLPALVFTTPTQTEDEAASRVEMAPRADISSILGGLSGDLSAILGLLNPTTLSNIESVVNHLAELLDDDKTTNQTKSLINTADELLSGPLLGEIGGLITQSFITDVQSLITNADALLTPQFVNETVGLINEVAPVRCP
jgi:hypothetical protein